MAKKRVVVEEEPIEEVIEGDSEGKEDSGPCTAYFDIHDGQRMLRVQALKNCWALQRWKTNINRKTGEEESYWENFKWFVDIGSLAGKIFDLRLKNSEATTIEELATMARTIRSEIRREFKLQ